AKENADNRAAAGSTDAARVSWAPSTPRRPQRFALPSGAMAKRAPLDEARVIAVALDILDEVGFDVLTVRRIAARLGVANPALYWHFRSKAEIIDRMASHLLAGAVVPPRPPREWRRY